MYMYKYVRITAYSISNEIIKVLYKDLNNVEF